MAIQIREATDRRADAVTELAAALRRELGDVRDDAYTRHLYAGDASMYAREPLVVVCPRDAAEVAAAIRIAGRYDVPVVSRGGGTSLAGQTAGQGVVLDTSRHMDTIGEIDTEARRVRVGPGVVQEDLNRAANRLGLGFGPDTSTSNRATIGGMIGNNSSGSHSIVYGCTIDHVHELEVVLADGSQYTFGAGPSHIADGLREILRDHADSIATGYPKHWRQSGGYRLDYLARDFDLAKFVTGSEGTLVAITEAEVGLVPLAEGAHVRGRPLRVGGGRGGGHRGRAGARPGRGRDDRLARSSSCRAPSTSTARCRRRSRATPARCCSSPSSPTRRRRRAPGSTSSSWGTHYHTIVAETAAEQEALTKVRKAGLGLLMAASEGARRPLAFVEDTAVAPERLGDYVASFREVLDRHGLTAGWYGHCSVGCLHIRPFVDLTEPGGIETMRSVAEEILDLVVEFDGVNSSEHGDGRARSEFNRRVFGDDLYEAFRKVKALFDPHGRLNPGVMVDAAPMTVGSARPGAAAAGTARHAAALPGRDARGGRPLPADRRLPQDRRRRHVPVVHGHARGGARHARARQRAGEGAVLARPAGRDGGRAAARDPRPLPRVQGVQERVPAERRHGVAEGRVPLALPGRARRAAAVAAVRVDPDAEPARDRRRRRCRTWRRGRLLERVAGIDRRRPLPRFSRETLIRWDEADARRSTGRELVFLADSFTTFTEPAIGRAAIELLEAAGWSVRLESGGCCGRSSISKGLLDRARGMAADMTERLAPYAERGVPIVGCEPSCLLTLREEHLCAPAGQSARARRRGPGEAGGGAAGRGDRRRVAAARSGLARRGFSGSSSTGIATRRRWRGRARRSSC